MNILLAIAVMIVIIIASYLADRKYPTKRIFIIPCGIILLCFVAVYSSLVIPSSSNSISTEQRLAILNEQPYFITWYNDYKEDINQLDRFATVYHKIISNYENQSISATEALSQLQRLYDETNAFNNSLQDALPPSELSQNNYTLVYNILEKTRVYSYKLNETVRQSIVIINEGTYNQIEHKETGTALGMTSWFSGKERHCWQKEFLFLLSVGSLGCLVYYINRPAYHNLDCITMPAAIMAAYWGQKGIEFIKNEEWKRFDSLSLRHVTVSGVGLICTVAVLAMATGTVLQFAQNSKIKENYHNVQEFEDFAEQIAAVVPENTPSFGINVPEICSMLHRRTECFTMDFSDMLVRPDSLKELKDQLEHAEVPGAFTGKSSMNIWKRNDPETYRWFMDHYELKETIPFYGEKFLYYIKK